MVPQLIALHRPWLAPVALSAYHFHCLGLWRQSMWQWCTQVFCWNLKLIQFVWLVKHLLTCLILQQVSFAWCGEFLDHIGIIDESSTNYWKICELIDIFLFSTSTGQMMTAGIVTWQGTRLSRSLVISEFFLYSQLWEHIENTVSIICTS